MNKPPVIHVVTPESSSGKLWAEVQRLQAVEAESARTIAHLNQTHREVSEMQQARIAELESVLAHIGDCREHPQCANARLARRAIEQTEPTPSTERIAKLEEALNTIADHRTQLPWSECRRIARAALGPVNLQETDTQQARIEELEKALTYIAKFAESMRKLGTPANLQDTAEPVKHDG